jgi:methionyl aminopeptidase
MTRTVLKSPAEIRIMDEANRIVREILAELEARIRPGMSTLEIDAFAEDRIRRRGGVPAFKGYPHSGGGRDFPGTVCASINDEVVHGIPKADRRLREGDIVSVDLGVHYQGYYGDAAQTFPVGEIDDRARTLLKVTRESLARGVEQAREGNRVSDIGHEVQSYVEQHGFSVVREFVGHGIGSRLHGEPGHGARLVAGMALAIEPMVNVGSPEVLLSADDGWTARTRDGSLSAHFEVSVAVSEHGPVVLGGPLSW